MPANMMLWIAAIFPVLSFVVGGLMYFLWKNAWIATLVVFGGSLAALLVWFSMQFWPWLLMYLFLCWLGCWAGHYGRSLRSPVPAVHKDQR